MLGGVVVVGGLLFSRGREWEGTGPYGDPRCTEQLNALSLFCSLLVVLATELAHRDREREQETERELGLNNMLLFLQQQRHWHLFTYSKSQSRCHRSLGIPRNTLWREHSAGSERPLLKRGPWTISGYQEKPRKKMYLLFTDHENKHDCVERRGLARLYVTAGV